MVSTSANMKGKKPVTTQQEVEELFEGLSIVEGSLGTLNSPTPIQDIQTDKWIRE
jgi:tRNA A37 threonylcarbamoyladenosine synthetase subunit TsaC/SUA5/YrdC